MTRACIELADQAPQGGADLDLSALTALLVESDSRRLADGFVILSKGRYIGMGTGADVMRALQNSRVLAGRYTNPLTLLPGQVPINEHLDRLLARKVAFTAWFVEVAPDARVERLRGLRKRRRAHSRRARLVESECQHGVDFAGT